MRWLLLVHSKTFWFDSSTVDCRKVKCFEQKNEKKKTVKNSYKWKCNRIQKKTTTHRNKIWTISNQNWMVWHFRRNLCNSNVLLWSKKKTRNWLPAIGCRTNINHIIIIIQKCRRKRNERSGPTLDRLTNFSSNSNSQFAIESDLMCERVDMLDRSTIHTLYAYGMCSHVPSPYAS